MGACCSNPKKGSGEDLLSDAASNPAYDRGSTRGQRIKKQAIFAAAPVKSYKSFPVPKSVEDSALIHRRLHRFFMVDELTEAQVANMVQLMFPRDYEEGDVVMQEGTEADNLYIVESGAFQIEARGAILDTIRLTKDISSESDSIQPFFGELAILYNSPRSATIKVCVVWVA